MYLITVIKNKKKLFNSLLMFFSGMREVNWPLFPCLKLIGNSKPVGLHVKSSLENENESNGTGSADPGYSLKPLKVRAPWILVFSLSLFPYKFTLVFEPKWCYKKQGEKLWPLWGIFMVHMFGEVPVAWPSLFYLLHQYFVVVR